MRIKISKNCALCTNRLLYNKENTRIAVYFAENCAGCKKNLQKIWQKCLLKLYDV